MNNIKISIICPTYNHEKYIEESINSFLSQKTNFLYEVIVGDDCSTDKTRTIIEKYEKKFPNIIKPVYRKKNIGSIKNLVDLLCRANGKYISICDGDDFFTDITKLQTQVDFLEKNKKYSLCFHPVKVIFECGNEIPYLYPNISEIYKFSKLELTRWNFIQTNSAVFCNLHNYKMIPTNIIPGDWYINLFHAKHGKIGFINKVMSCYRKQPNGLWWNYKKDINLIINNFFIQQFNLFFEIKKLFNEQKYINNINKNLEFLFSKIIEADIKQNSELTKKLLDTYPKEMSEYFISNHLIKDQNKQEEFNQIVDSKFYKVWIYYKKIKKTILKLIHK